MVRHSKYILVLLISIFRLFVFGQTSEIESHIEFAIREYSLQYVDFIDRQKALGDDGKLRSKGIEELERKLKKVLLIDSLEKPFYLPTIQKDVRFVKPPYSSKKLNKLMKNGIIVWKIKAEKLNGKFNVRVIEFRVKKSGKNEEWINVGGDTFIFPLQVLSPKLLLPMPALPTGQAGQA